MSKIIRPLHPTLPEKAQVELEDGDHLYREIRIDNILETEEGKEVRLKEGAAVDVVIEADTDATESKR